ncbi:MAG: hypothetical protein IKV88_01530 [Clostridia bacterium]|nr:hypothetical protein [Clostridia bacterium]
MSKNNKGFSSVKVLTGAAMLTAFSVIIGIVCKNFLTFNVYYRITFENLPIILAGLLYGLRNLIGKCDVIHKFIMQFCRNNTPYYAIHPFYYCCITATAGYLPFSSGLCTVIAVIVGFLCYATILLWNRIRK